MKLLIGFFVAVAALSAQSFYAKVEPNRTYTVAAAVPGLVVAVDKDVEGKVAGKATVVQLDDKMDKIDLETSRSVAASLEETYRLRQKNYEKIAAMSTRTPFEKDMEKIAVLGALTSWKNAAYKVELLEDTIAKKRISAHGLLVYRLLVEKGAYVAMGTPLFEAQDVSRSRVTVFVPKEEMAGLETSVPAVDGKTGVYVIDKVWKVADREFVSSYRVELVGPAPERFSEVVKVEFLRKKGE